MGTLSTFAAATACDRGDTTLSSTTATTSAIYDAALATPGMPGMVGTTPNDLPSNGAGGAVSPTSRPMTNMAPPVERGGVIPPTQPTDPRGGSLPYAAPYNVPYAGGNGGAGANGTGRMNGGAPMNGTQPMNPQTPMSTYGSTQIPGATVPPPNANGTVPQTVPQ